MELQKNRGEAVPLALVMPHVQEWINAWYGVGGAAIPRGDNPYVTPEAVRREHPEWKASTESLPVLLLASTSGLLPTNIGGWLRRWKGGRGSQYIGYFDADRLFTAMHKTDLWARDPHLRAVRDECVRERAEEAAMLSSSTEGES